MQKNGDKVVDNYKKLQTLLKTLKFGVAFQYHRNIYLAMNYFSRGSYLSLLQLPVN